MKPVNNKSLFAFICTQMEKLDDNVIDYQQAKEMSNLIVRAQKALDYELKRAEVEVKLSEHKKTTGEKIELREIESKGFDDTTNIKE